MRPARPRRGTSCWLVFRDVDLRFAIRLRRVFTQPQSSWRLLRGIFWPLPAPVGRDRFQAAAAHAGVTKMDIVWDILAFMGHAIEAVMTYVETHHWIFGFLVAGYL